MSPFHCRNKTHTINAFNVKIDIGLNNKMATRVGMPVTSIQTNFWGHWWFHLKSSTMRLHQPWKEGWWGLVSVSAKIQLWEPIHIPDVFRTFLNTLGRWVLGMNCYESALGSRRYIVMKRRSKIYGIQAPPCNVCIISR